jgi:acetyl esterase/lipase
MEADTMQQTALRFDPETYEVRTLERDGKTLVYRAFEHIPYVQYPVHPIQKLSVYVPETFYEDGGSVNGYTLHTAPIFFPNTVGGYMPGPEEAPGPDFMGRTNASFYALLHGYVVVSAGVRGRGCRDANSHNCGMAPADIVDLKAAVRWIRHNKDLLPGNAERIISNGTSAGGAMSSLLACTGNHPDYEPYLTALGAAKGRDDVFGASCYCPITNLDHADMAYEWEFHGIPDYHRMEFVQENGPKDHPNLLFGKPPKMRRVDAVMTDEMERCSDLLAPMFPTYFNSLGLHTEDGTALSMNPDGSGNFTDYILTHVLTAADKAMAEGKNIMEEPGVSDWLTVENGKAKAADWKKYVAFRTRMKPAPAFDDIRMGTAETELFGSADQRERHFTEFSMEHDTSGHPALADAEQIRLMNPMYYIKDARADKAPHVRIRHGAVDRDTSLAISEILYLSLRAAGVDADIAHPWGIPHAGDYDLPELFAWIDQIVKE